MLIGGGYFPLSPHSGRRLQRVQYNAAYPPTIGFGLGVQAVARRRGKCTASPSRGMM